MKTQTGMKWLRSQMAVLGYNSLEEVATDMGINRGNLYRYFSLETRPSIAMLPVLCSVLDTDVNTMLKALKVINSRESL